MARIPINLGEMAVSGRPGDVLVAYALGSCVAVAMFAPDARLCGLAHVVVPGEATAEPPGKPAYHAVNGVRALVAAMRRMGAATLHVSLAGGAAVIDTITIDVGRRNVLCVRKALWGLGLVAVAEDVGGNESRTVSMDVPSGVVRVRNANRGSWVLEQEQR